MAGAVGAPEPEGVGQRRKRIEHNPMHQIATILGHPHQEPGPGGHWTRAAASKRTPNLFTLKVLARKDAEGRRRRQLTSGTALLARHLPRAVAHQAERDVGAPLWPPALPRCARHCRGAAHETGPQAKWGRAEGAWHPSCQLLTYEPLTPLSGRPASRTPSSCARRGRGPRKIPQHTQQRCQDVLGCSQRLQVASAGQVHGARGR